MLESFIWIALELTVLFVVISFVLSLLQSFIPYEKVEDYLRTRSKWKAGLFAIVFAFITPFCSCSTIPVVVNMLRNKVPFGLTMVFLFSSPLLDPTILTVMGVILGWQTTVIYTLVTAVFSLVLGFTLERLGFEKYVKPVMVKGYHSGKKKWDVKRALRETGQMMKSVFPFLIIGAAIGAGIHGLVPASFIAENFGHQAWWLIPLAALLGIPLYIRLSSMIPISQVLLLKGMALGPIMALLISSAGASLPEVVLLKSIFHIKLVAVFVLSVLTMATLSGLIFYFI
ncbi:permease [Jeotgalibacillus haloalkalitolerans]|uniref:Permease n=1 Tax=Jeotgalibacillus haloalkalitolerans TaxID=3104292 RepID=A0ABU5KIN3_9BACL|nr:permease [Jeotgalibacillus sp. HH7-29]MDZ5711109.1 permease [Jeotgalibacillus sp. HH7-29]